MLFIDKVAVDKSIRHIIRYKMINAEKERKNIKFDHIVEF